jgi:hypothetical protein
MFAFQSRIFKRFFGEGWGGGRSEPVPVTVHEYIPTAIAHIRQMKNGRYRLLENENEVVATYARYRDALRGAERRGLTVV